MGLKDDMQLDHQKVAQYFKDIEDFVACLEKLHPHHFPKDIKTKLKEVRNIILSNTSNYIDNRNGRIQFDLTYSYKSLEYKWTNNLDTLQQY